VEAVRERCEAGILQRVGGFPTPEDAASNSVPAKMAHLVQSRISADGQSAWVLLAVEAAGTGYCLDENICEREPDGSWSASSSGGGGFTDRSLDDLRANPPRQGLYS
jgi:hypothetical protein